MDFITLFAVFVCVDGLDVILSLWRSLLLLIVMSTPPAVKMV